MRRQKLKKSFVENVSITIRGNCDNDGDLKDTKDVSYAPLSDGATVCFTFFFPAQHQPPFRDHDGWLSWLLSHTKPTKHPLPPRRLTFFNISTFHHLLFLNTSRYHGFPSYRTPNFATHSAQIQPFFSHTRYVAPTRLPAPLASRLAALIVRAVVDVIAKTSILQEPRDTHAAAP